MLIGNKHVVYDVKSTPDSERAKRSASKVHLIHVEVSFNKEKQLVVHFWGVVRVVFSLVAYIFVNGSMQNCQAYGFLE